MANSPARAIVDVGTVIADTYKIEALLGRGGMGAVFRASHKRLAGKQVAIKILHTEIEDPDIVARFKREADIAAKLNHPNIVGVIDYNVEPNGMPYLVLDYLEGETLAQAIARGPMAIEQVLSIVRQVGSALAAAHRAGIVHRDLKPQNIFLVPTVVDGREVEIAKVLDFGISKIHGSQTIQTQESTLLGTPQYMAPEQATGQHASIDERTDVFAFGAIVYEMLSGQPAFSGASIPEVVFKVVYEPPAPLATLAPGTPPAMVSAVAQAMAKPVDERLANVATFVEALTGQPLTATRGPPSASLRGSDSPSAGRRVGNLEAFAHTVGVGDHDDSPVNPLLATVAPPSAAIDRSAHSANAAAPTVDLHLGPGARATGRQRRTGLIAAVAIAGAALAAGAAYLVTRQRARQDANQVSTVDPSTLATVEPTADPKPADPKPADPKPADPKPAGPRLTTPRTRHAGSGNLPVTTADTDGDPDARALLKQAASALDRHDYDLAERLANAVLNSAASGRQHATARLIHGTVQCVARNDQERAQIDLRGLAGYRALKTRLLSVCKNHGILGP
jgi:eukaryotic-like serine/threonine-protein kinase